MKFNKGDWVVIGGGKVAHFLGQGYNGLTAICTPETHRLGMSFSADVEQEDMKKSNGAKKCKRCLARIAKWRN